MSVAISWAKRCNWPSVTIRSVFQNPVTNTELLLMLKALSIHIAVAYKSVLLPFFVEPPSKTIKQQHVCTLLRALPRSYNVHRIFPQ